MTTLSKVNIRDVGYAKRIKEAYPKKVCHVLIEHVSKNKYAYPKKVCHMPIRHVKKKEKRKR